METISLSIIKPEADSLDVSAREALTAVILQMAGDLIIRKQYITITFEQAKALWESSVEQFPWGSQYYQHMAQNVEVIVFKGSDTATEIKKRIRELYADDIDRLSETSSFDLDLIHGSDPDKGEEELTILGIQI